MIAHSSSDQTSKQRRPIPLTIASLLKFRLMLWGKFRERLFSYLAIYIKCFLPWGLMDLVSSLSWRRARICPHPHTRQLRIPKHHPTCLCQFKCNGLSTLSEIISLTMHVSLYISTQSRSDSKLHWPKL